MNKKARRCDGLFLSQYFLILLDVSFFSLPLGSFVSWLQNSYQKLLSAEFSTTAQIASINFSSNTISSSIGPSLLSSL